MQEVRGSSPRATILLRRILHIVAEAERMHGQMPLSLAGRYDGLPRRASWFRVCRRTTSMLVVYAQCQTPCDFFAMTSRKRLSEGKPMRKVCSVQAAALFNPTRRAKRQA